MDRSKMISQLEDPSEVFDFLVIGGGATGIGIALDASTRGYRVALFEQSDFTKGTSSRSTKLVHIAPPLLRLTVTNLTINS